MDFSVPERDGRETDEIINDSAEGPAKTRIQEIFPVSQSWLDDFQEGLDEVMKRQELNNGSDKAT